MDASGFSYGARTMNLSVTSTLLALISSTVIFSGCSSDRVITFDKIEERNGIYYEVNQATPYTGLVQSFYPGGQKKAEGSLQDGKPKGVQTAWQMDGKKISETTY